MKLVIPNSQATNNVLNKCKNYIDNTGAFSFKFSSFTQLFFFSFCWYSHKRRSQLVKTPLSLVEFKAFLRKILGDSKASMYTTWSHLR